MHTTSRLLVPLILMLTCACSTVIEGRSQQVTVKSSPEGAQCILKQADDIVARVTTPGTVEIRKTKNDLVIFCTKDGYESASITNRSDMSIASLGNMAFYQLSFLGNAVDSISGASNKYDSDVLVTLAPAMAPAAFPAPSAPLAIRRLPNESIGGMTMQAPMPAYTLMPQPIVPAATLQARILPPATPTHTLNPPIQAALELANAASNVTAHEQMAQLSYVQQMAEIPHRPPFEITQ